MFVTPRRMNCKCKSEWHPLIAQLYVLEYKSTNDNTVNVWFMAARKTNGRGTKADEKDAPPA